VAVCQAAGNNAETPRLWRCLTCLLFAGLTFSVCAAADKEPKDATEWFQRASDQMDLRAPGSTPFHMKVVFHALPGMVLSKNETDQIISGDGTYEETWAAPKRWRREVNFGSYHAIEVQSESARKMQGSSDYEPSRVLMLLEALLYPIPRALSSPSLSEGRTKWKIENGAAGSLSYVKISHTSTRADILHAYLFLSNGLLVQSIEAGIVTSWQDQVAFGGKLVPRHFGVQGGTRDLLMAEVTVEAAGTVDPAAFELPGEPAQPGMTLRPLHWYECTMPETSAMYSYTTDNSRTARWTIRRILDRHGVIREAEIIESPNPGTAKILLSLIRDDKFHPAKIDNSPCEIPESMSYSPR
jgi:hypothetical protein